MTFAEQVFLVLLIVSVVGASITYWRTHRRHR